MTMPFSEDEPTASPQEEAPPQLSYTERRLASLARRSVEQGRVLIPELDCTNWVTFRLGSLGTASTYPQYPERFITARAVEPRIGQLLVLADTWPIDDWEGKLISMGSYPPESSGPLKRAELIPNVIIPNARAAVDLSGQGFRSDTQLKLLPAQFMDAQISQSPYGAYQIF